MHPPFFLLEFIVQYPFFSLVTLVLLLAIASCDSAPQQTSQQASEQTPATAEPEINPSDKNQTPTNAKVLALAKPWSVAIHLIDDGALLAGLSHADNYLQIWSLNQNRELTAYELGQTGFHPDTVRWLDWDNDGEITELLVAAEGAERLELWQFQEYKLQKLNDFPTEDALQIINVADLDQNGWLDIVAGPYEGERVSVFLRNQEGKITEPLYLPAGQKPNYPKIVDWNSDGLLDIIWSDWVSETLHWAENKGQGTFKVKVLLEQTAERPREISIGDINGDNNPDILVASELGKAAIIHYGSGDGKISSSESIPAVNLGYITGTIHRDNDQKTTSLALAEWDAIVLAIRKDDEPWSYWRRPTEGSMPQDVQFLDIDQDSHLDLIFANSAGEQIEILFGPLTDNMESLSF